MPIAFDRSVCCDLNETIAREWLITNGRGGYASGTGAGVLTRMQHGLLVSSPLDAKIPDTHKGHPYILLAKIDEEVVFDQRTYYLGTNEYQDGTLNPSGYAHLETFRLEEGFPVFTYRVGGIDGILLEKRIWMPSDQNTTYIQYRVLRNAPSARNYSPAGAINRAPTANRSFRNGYEHYSGYAESMQRMLTLTLLPFSAYRPYDQPQYGNNDWHFQVEPHSRQDAIEEGIIDEGAISGGVINRGGAINRAPTAGCTIRAWDGARPYHIMAVGHVESEVTFIPTGVWYWHFLRRHDQAAGRPAIDDLYLPGIIRAKLWPGEDSSSSSTLTIIASAEELSTQTLSTEQLHLSYKRSVERQRNLSQPRRYFGEGGEAAQPFPVLPFPTDSLNQIEDEEFLRLLFQAGDRFVTRRDSPRSGMFYEGEQAPLVVSSYFNGGENTRDALIALPGLLLVTGRYDVAARILRGLARHFRQGLLPDRLPTPGDVLEERDYGSVDTTLWYFYALDAYLQVTRDYELLDDLYPRLADSISWYREGTYHGIAVDPEDGLLRTQQEGKALTWMNAMSKGVPVTPRSGKAVEVNALWYLALSLMHEWSHILYSRGQINFIPAYYNEQSRRCKQSFNTRFWYDTGRYLYDIIDGPKGDDTSLRPNLLLALSLRYPVLNQEHYRPVLDAVTQQLVTPYGLRTLAPNEAGYCGHLKENVEEQQEGLHQGSVWPWLIGPYAEALLRVEDISSFLNGKQTSETQRHQESVWRSGIQLLDAFRTQLEEGVLGMVGGVFDGDAPHNAGYAVASAISVGEILRVYNLLARISIRHLASAISI